VHDLCRPVRTVLIGATLVFFLFPKQAGEETMLAGFQRKDAGVAPKLGGFGSVHSVAAAVSRSAMALRKSLAEPRLGAQ
jgi:hypothetical protein